MLYTKEEIEILYDMFINNGYIARTTDIICDDINENIKYRTYRWGILEVPYEDLPLSVGDCTKTDSIILSWRLKIGK